MKMEIDTIGTRNLLEQGDGAVSGVIGVVEKKLTEANKIVSALSITALKLQDELRQVDYELTGIAIYLSDMKEVCDEKRRKQLEREL